MPNLHEFLTPIKQTKVYTQIVEKFIDLIEQGVFTAGMQLPSERELARQLGVSRASLREALTALQMMGLVETISGAGTFISKEPKAAPLNYSPPNLGESPFLILQARKVIEPAVAALAATQRKQQAVHKITKILALLETKCSGSQIFSEEFSELDRQFHLEIARATGNPILAATQEMIHSLMGQPLWLALIGHSTVNTPGRFGEAMKEHRGIFEAIQNKDEQLASIRAKAHLYRVEKIMKEVDLANNFQDHNSPKLHPQENDIEILAPLDEL
jgi:DNA-binding FadR family transcriptional regulator